MPRSTCQKRQDGGRSESDVPNQQALPRGRDPVPRDVAARLDNEKANRKCAQRGEQRVFLRCNHRPRRGTVRYDRQADDDGFSVSWGDFLDEAVGKHRARQGKCCRQRELVLVAKRTARRPAYGGRCKRHACDADVVEVDQVRARFSEQMEQQAERSAHDDAGEQERWFVGEAAGE